MNFTFPTANYLLSFLKKKTCVAPKYILSDHRPLPSSQPNLVQLLDDRRGLFG